MKKLLIVMVVVLSLVACTPAKKTAFSWLAPKGAPAVALIPLLKTQLDQIELVDGTDVISAELIKGDKDLIIAPINLGTKLIQAENANYKLLAVVTWGNLYIVKDESVSYTNLMNMAMFGSKSVPELILDQVANQLSFTYTKIPFNAVADVKAQLVAKTYALGLLAEPNASATIAAAKAQGITLSVVADLQAAWKAKTGFANYPQAAVFVKASLNSDQIKQIKDRIQSMSDYVKAADADQSGVETDITALTPTLLGVPSAALVKSSWERLNINVKYASDVKTEITTFLALFDLTLDNKNIISK